MALLQVQNYENEIILNTPNRNEILKEGPPLHAKNNILGRGAYGTVFKAIFQAQQVAVKVVRNVKHANVESMQSEANILGWKHCNIVKVFKIESTPKFGIVIMERFNGQCLQTVLESVVLPLVHRVFISLDILSALCYCHKHNLLHLDIKPQNVLVSFESSTAKVQVENILPTQQRRSYICKLCDFGASMKIGAQQSKLLKGSAKGTLRYMSPEALREETLTCAADIYSLGVTMWQLKQRRLPYYWIECNEVVAYQVVKHQLRPDCTPSIRHNASDLTHGNCFCANYIAEEITYHSLEDIKNMLNRAKPLEQQLHFSACDAVNVQMVTPAERRPFRMLNSKLNVMRDLRAELDLKTTMKQRLKEPECGAHVDLRAMFADTTEQRGKQRGKEISYQALYRCCWQNDTHLRPSALELHKRLIKLL